MSVHNANNEHTLTMGSQQNDDLAFDDNTFSPQPNNSAMKCCNISFLKEKEVWNMFGYSIPKQEVVFFTQIIALYIVIIIGLINVTLQNGNSNLWLSLLSASLGYLLPNPSLKRETVILRGS